MHTRADAWELLNQWTTGPSLIRHGLAVEACMCWYARKFGQVDELSGLIIAVAHTRPNKTLAEVTPESVLKSFRKKGFAAGVNRDDVLQRAEELGISLEEHVANCLAGLQESAGRVGM
jgi:predicted hydrolase (HD superfamily)